MFSGKLNFVPATQQTSRNYHTSEFHICTMGSGVATGESRGGRVPPLTAKNLPNIGKKREKIMQNRGKKEKNWGKKRQKSGRFFHFPPVREDWLRYWPWVNLEGKKTTARWRHQKLFFFFLISVFWIPCIGGAWWKTSTAQIGWESVHGSPRYGRMNT